MEITENYKILLVDDDPKNIRDLFEALNADRYKMFVAANGAKAIEQSLKHKPDAIIMDWDMPEMNGIDAIKIIRHHDEIKNIPIIMATGKMTSVENLRTALEIGANDYIRKPFDVIEIEARVNSMIMLHLEHKKNIELEKENLQAKLDKMSREIELNQQALAASKIRWLYNSAHNEILIKNLEKIAQTNKKAEKMINEIVSELKTNDKSFNWTEFENHFEKVHPSFVSALLKRYPVTTNEIQLCVFIKLNMTNREIIAITYKTEVAIKKARQRLKKKFGLNTDDSLHNYINEIE